MSKEVSIKFRLKVVVVISLLFAIGYGGTNRFPIFEPRTLSFIFIDDWMGFRPWTVWIYMSDYIMIFLPIFLIHNVDVMKRLIKGFIVNFAIHYPIFLLFPTTLNRSVLSPEGINGMVFEFLWFIDDAVNCFPSQHVSLCFLVAMAFWGYRNKLSIVFYIWAIAISLSTMTTKQHYFWDVLGGITVAFIVYWFVFRKKTSPKISLAD